MRGVRYASQILNLPDIIFWKSVSPSTILRIDRRSSWRQFRPIFISRRRWRSKLESVSRTRATGRETEKLESVKSTPGGALSDRTVNIGLYLPANPNIRKRNFRSIRNIPTHRFESDEKLDVKFEQTQPPGSRKHLNSLENRSTLRNGWKRRLNDVFHAKNQRMIFEDTKACFHFFLVTNFFLTVHMAVVLSYFAILENSL